MGRPRKKLSKEERNIKSLATFRILGGDWEDFGELCSRSNSTASEVLVKFIEKCLRDEHLNIDTKEESKDPPSDENLDKVTERLDKLERVTERLDELVEKYGEKINDLEVSTGTKKHPQTQKPPRPPIDMEKIRVG